jgi:anaerobic selenocysteine-containing dehydrogenase
MIHASGGVLEPLSKEQKSEPAIVAGIAAATLGNFPIDWNEVVSDYDLIREHIAAVVPGFNDFNQRILQDGGFYLGNSARERNWKTPAGKAICHTHVLPESILPKRAQDLLSDKTLIMQTLRSHDQYNTTIYGMNDRYRGIKGERKVVFINPADIQRLGFEEGQSVTLRSIWDDGVERKVSGFKLVPYSIPAGNIAAYYPETNPLVPLDSHGEFSNTPTSKSIAIELEAYEEESNGIEVAAV